MTSFGEWLQIQSGVPPWRDYSWDPTPRYIRNGRELAEWIHYDYLFQPFLNASLILLNYRPESVLNENRWVLSPLNPYKTSKVQDGFATFGFAQALDWLGRVTDRSPKSSMGSEMVSPPSPAPETVGGRIHQTRTGTVAYPLHSSLLGSSAVEETYKRWGSYLLPQAYRRDLRSIPLTLADTRRLLVLVQL